MTRSSHGWIDVTVPLRSGMVHWPGDPEVRVERFATIDDGDESNVGRIEMGLHTGTHMDAPLHYLRSGPGIDAMPPSATIGPARVIEIRDPVSVRPAELLAHGIRRGERLLLRTASSGREGRWERFFEDFVYVSLEAARLLAETRIRTLGVDYLSVAGFRSDGAATHRLLLDAGIWLIEGLDLSAVRGGLYEMICLPLRVEGGDGAPARCLLRPLHESRVAADEGAAED